MEAARDLARAMHKYGAKLVYGGGTVGLMGEIARTLVSLSGPDSVHGIIPKALVRYEQAGREGQTPGSGIDEKIFGRTSVVADMHTRKQTMTQEVLKGGPGSGFVALSGGYGTMEELMEITTWNQLGIHKAGIVLYNVAGFYDGLLTWINGAVSGGFVAQSNAGIIQEAKDAETVVTALKDYQVAKGRFDLDWNEK